ncbi:MAG: MarR family winged helix-turn-helix transcriptional regulator [Micrococcales bacterium]
MSKLKSLTKPHWLPAPDLEAWLSMVALSTLLPAALDTQLIKDSGITHFDYMVMSMLAEAQDRTLRMSELATRTNASLSRLSHVVKKLESKGLIQRVACETDARATNAHLTRLGFQTWLESAPKHLAEVRRIVFDTLTPQEIETMKVISQKLTQKLDPERKMVLRKPKNQNNLNAD